MIAVLTAALMLLCGTVPALADAFSAIVTAKSMAVYSEFSLTNQLGTLKQYSVVQVTGYTSTVAKISWNGYSGYARISDMKTVDEVAQKAVTSGEIPVYDRPDTDSPSINLDGGTRVYILAESGEWAMVEREGAVGYAKLADLTKTDETWNTPAAQASGVSVRTYAAAITESAKVYKSASTSSTQLGTLKAGTQVTVKATSGAWALIELEGRTGYCLLSHVREISADAEPTPTPTVSGGQSASVSAASLAVYQKASTTSKKLGTLKKGQAVTLLASNDRWAYIELNGHYGYCAVDGLARDDQSEPEPSSTYSPDLSNAKTGTVTAASLAVYQTASTKGKKLGTLKKGQTVHVLQANGNWAYIELNGHYGFCSAKGISVSEEEDGVPSGYKAADFTATVVDPEARVYASPRTDSENLKLTLGMEVQVRAYNDQWACIQQGNRYGFVSIRKLSRAEYADIDADGDALQTLLKALLSTGYYDAVPSTTYNAAAISAIKRFQAAIGQPETGVADQVLQRIAFGGYAPTSPLLASGLSSGDKGDSVSRLQARLYALGYLTKSTSLDGDYGTTTSSAVKLFQSASGLTATGEADVDTLKAMYSTGAAPLPAGTKAADASSGGSSGGYGTSYLDNVPSGLASTTSNYSEGMSNPEKLEYAIYLAQTSLGCPYVYGAAGPSKFDCSGLTTYIFKAIGINLKRSAYAQGYDETYPKIEGSDKLKRGDLVFFNTISDSDLSDHAGVYIGSGYFIHASSGGHRVVVSNLTTGYYSRVFSWGRRVFN